MDDHRGNADAVSVLVMIQRRVLRKHPALREDIGDLITRRPLPGPGLRSLDPFLALSHHGPQIYPPNSYGLPFGPHPHRGFETVTFIIEGVLAHQDSAGHESVIGTGGVQWMTAGAGLVHAEVSPELFKRNGGPLEILQLWINLPARLKRAPPAYRGLDAEDIPKLIQDDGRVTIDLVSGTFGDRTGAFTPLTDMAIAVVRLAPGGSVVLPAPTGHEVLLYAISGEVIIADEKIQLHYLAEIGHDGDEVMAHSTAGSTVLFAHSPPLRETVVWHGPFVMNTRAEISQAFDDYYAGRLGVL
jgi:quercetin 2,3-dioxygenase